MNTDGQGLMEPKEQPWVPRDEGFKMTVVALKWLNIFQIKLRAMRQSFGLY